MNHNHDTVRREQAAFAAQQIHQGAALMMETFYRRMAHLFIDFPDRLEVRTELSAQRMTFAVIPDPMDAGKLIGSKGAMYHAFLILLNALAARNGVRIHFRLETSPSNGPASGLAKFKARKDWPRARLVGAFEACCEDLFGVGSFQLAHIDDKEDIKTHFKLTVAAGPLHATELELKDSLSKVWHACGRAHGRYLFLEALERTKE